MNRGWYKSSGFIRICYPGEVWVAGASRGDRVLLWDRNTNLFTSFPHPWRLYIQSLAPEGQVSLLTNYITVQTSNGHPPGLKGECGVRTGRAVATVELLEVRVDPRMKSAIRPPSECRSLFGLSPGNSPSHLAFRAPLLSVLPVLIFLMFSQTPPLLPAVEFKGFRTML